MNTFDSLMTGLDTAAQAVRNEAESGAETRESGARLALNEFGMEEIGAAQRDDIASRGDFVADTEAELLEQIQKALTRKDNKQHGVFVGILKDSTKERIERETGRKLFKAGSYAFGVRYDDIVHLQKHFPSEADITLAIQDVYRIFEDHDSVNAVESKDGRYIKLLFKKAENVIELESLTPLSKRKRYATIETVFLSRGSIEKWRSIPRPVVGSDAGNYGGTPLHNSNIAQPENGVNADTPTMTTQQVEALLNRLQQTGSTNAAALAGF